MNCKKRCKWCNLKNDLYVTYHDTEWCAPNFDDKYLYEMLILESFQAGLSWECVLNKRESFRKAYDGFDLDKVISSNILSQKNEPLLSKIDSNISGLDKIELTNNYTIKQPFSIYNLNPNGDLIGHLILEHNNIQNDQLTEFAVEFIIKYLETD